MSKKITLSSIMSYNSKRKYSRKQTVQKGRFNSDVKRTKQITNYRRGERSYPLWWNLFNCVVLQKTETKSTFAKESCFPPAVRIKSPNGSDFGNYLCNNCWDKPIKQNKDTTTEWDVSENSWTQKFPLCEQFKEIPEAFRSKDYFWYQQSSRPIKIENVLSSSATNKYPIGFRFDRSNNLRQTDRRSQSRLQSWQKRQKVLSPLSLFRVLLQRLLAWGLKAGRRIYGCRCSGISTGMSPESSTLYLPYQSARRFRILRSQIHRAFRRRKQWLCDRSQTDRRHQEKALEFALSPVQERLVGGRIPVHANEMEKTPSFYRDSQKTTKPTTRTTNFVYPGTVFIPNICYKSSIGSSQYLVFLQKPSFYRNSYQRAKTRFLLDQNTNKQFLSQSNLFYFTSSGLQYNQLVQAPLSAGTIKERNFGYNPYRYFSLASQTDKTWEQKCTQSSRGAVSFKSVTESDNPENRKAKDQLIFTGLLNCLIPIPSNRCEYYAFSRFF